MRRLEFTTYVPATVSEVWDFFSSPANLGLITPEHMNFEFRSPISGGVYPGMFIAYRLSPMRGMRVSWVTEITHLEVGKYFIDEQRKGPYRIWHHEHHFRQVGSGTEMHDILYYSIPWGFIGKMTDKFLVYDKVLEIFKYREMKIGKIFRKGK